MSEYASQFIYNEGNHNDERIRLIADSIIGIKTIKCFNREEKYESLIKHSRNLQI